MGIFFEEFVVGSELLTVARTITETDVVTYTGLSGDFNPLHTDEEFSKTTAFGTRIAHGPLVFAIAMGLVNRLGKTDGTSLGSLAIKDWRFLAPVKMGDTVHCRVAIESKRRSATGERGILIRRIFVVNQKEETVQQGDIVTMVRARPTDET